MTYILIKRTRKPYCGGNRYSEGYSDEMEAETLYDAIQKAINHHNPVGYDVYVKVDPGDEQVRVWPDPDEEILIPPYVQ
jgi:hypothetical protein